MLEHLSKYDLVLGSGSPRRRELVAGLDIPVEVIAMPDIDEHYPSGLQREEIPLYLARLKADAYREMMTERTFLITADTIVWLDNRVYGKPADEEEARAMLRTLSGRTHEVITGVALTTVGRQEAFYAVSAVTFAELEEWEIGYYVGKYRPYDKAGGYGVQDWIGYVGVEGLEGSFYNVMGLPVRMLYRWLKGWGNGELRVKS
jgi:septum formation protein